MKTGHYLPPQLIYAGKTSKCLPKMTFPSGWSVTCTENHWANEVTTLIYMDEILFPHVRQKRKKLGLPDEQTCLVIFDRLKAQFTATVFEVLEENHILVALVPANCTDKLQPLDVSINKSVKEFLRDQFHLWYASEVSKQLQRNKDVKLVDLSLVHVKPLAATWLIKHRYNNLTGIGNGSTSRDWLLCISYGERQNYLKTSVLRLSNFLFSHGE